MKYEENEVRNLLAPILPKSAETIHKMKILFNPDNCTDKSDIVDFRDKIGDVLKIGEFISATVTNPFGAIEIKPNKDGIVETKEKFNELAINITYTDLINAQFEIGRVVRAIKPIMDMYAITTKKITKTYESKEGEAVGTEDEFSDIADGTVKEL